jgi:hypothetical protein
MDKAQTVADWMSERRIELADLLSATSLEGKILQAIIDGRYTPSPQQRRRVAAALGVNPEQVLWGHTTQVDHMYGHGPQFGRSP